jgi:3-oxoacyl-[acyl-carrier protein] reductase
VARRAEPLGERALAVELDVRDRESWRRALEAVVEAFGPIDALVNDAARTELGSIFELDPDEWDDVFAVNLRGAFLGLQVVGGSMRERGRGRIVNVSSDAAFSGTGATGAHYAASKAGLLALTRRAAAELAASGITVNAVAPGALDGETVREVATNLESVAAAIPVGRLGREGEVASLVVWLLSQDAGYVTGATFRIDGGATL